MKLKNTLTIFLATLSLFGFSQVPKKVIVEHFTNTLCSRCATRNPGLYANLELSGNQDVVHLAIHPSLPYNTCVFNLNNPESNDDRTKYYGVFGSTPQVIVNGEHVMKSFTDNDLFSPYQNQMSPVSIQLTQQKINDSTRVKIVVKTEATHSLGDQILYVVLAEETIDYDAPNGESTHHDVMRAPVTGNTGRLISIPSSVGDSLVFLERVKNADDWDMDQIYAVAILQNESDKLVNQVEALKPIDTGNVPLSIDKFRTETTFDVYPNPVQTELNISTGFKGLSSYVILSLTGKEILKGRFIQEAIIETQGLPNGVYFISISNERDNTLKKMIKIGN